MGAGLLEVKYCKYQSNGLGAVKGVPVYGVNASNSFARRARPRFVGMDHRDELREFLTSRRARLSPAEVGLPDSD